MPPSRHRLLRLGVAAEAVLMRVLATLERCFLSKEAAAKRASGRWATLKKGALEAERIDRLRNPRDYQGR